MKPEEFYERVLRRLDILVSLQLERGVLGNEQSTVAGKICRLSGMGLSASEISQVIGRPPNYVSAVMSAKKKREPRA